MEDKIAKNIKEDSLVGRINTKDDLLEDQIAKNFIKEDSLIGGLLRKMTSWRTRSQRISKRTAL
jgi:hypothetical protein